MHRTDKDKQHIPVKKRIKALSMVVSVSVSCSVCSRLVAIESRKLNSSPKVCDRSDVIPVTDLKKCCCIITIHISHTDPEHSQ